MLVVVLNCAYLLLCKMTKSFPAGVYVLLLAEKTYFQINLM